MPDLYDEIKAHIQAAIAFILPDKKPNIAKLARDFAVPESRLRARYKRRNDKSYCGGSSRILTVDQEIALCNIIKHEEIDEIHLQH